MVRSLLVWIAFSLCIAAVFGSILGAVLSVFSPSVTILGFLSLATLFLIEAIFLWKIARGASKSTMSTIIHIAKFIVAFLVIAFNVNLFHSPTGLYRSRPILEAIDMYKYKHNLYPRTFEEIKLYLDEPYKSKILYRMQDTYEYKFQGGRRYKLTINVGGPLRRRCFYYGPPREAYCRNGI